MVELTGISRDVHFSTRVFSIILPAAGAFAPITAFLMRKCGEDGVVALMGVLQALVALFSVLESYGLQYATMLIMVFNRFFFFAAAPLILKSLYGDRGINELYGILLFIAAIIGLSNYLWSWMRLDTFEGSFWSSTCSFTGAPAESLFYLPPKFACGNQRKDERKY